MTQRLADLGQQMQAEIRESAPAVGRILTEEIGADAFIQALRRCRGVALVARGSSDHAAAYGRYLLEQALGVPVWSLAPSQITRYHTKMNIDGLALIAISQSGRTPEIISVAESWLASGAVVAGITNDASSDLAALVAHPFLLDAGDELAVPATKTFSATLALFLRLGALLNPTQVPIEPQRLIEAFESAIADYDAVDKIVAAVDRASIVVHLGRGFLLPIAREAALKCIEAAKAPTFAWSPVDFRHGPFALAGTEMCAVVHHSDGRVGHDTAEIARRLLGAGATVTSIGSPLDRESSQGDAGHVEVSAGLAEHERPLVHTVRLQQLALNLARRRLINPDRPAGLEKMTATT